MPNLNTKDLYFKTIGTDTNTTWTGKFVVKLSLSPRDILTVDKLYREYIGNTNGTPPSDQAIYYAYMLSQLGVRLAEKPPWWTEGQNGLDLQDSNLLEEVWKSVAELIEAYQKDSSEKAEAAKGVIKKTVEREEKETGLTG